MGIFAVALGVRVVTAAQTAVIFNDGPYYIRVAALVDAGRWAEALGHDLHPLYPVLVAWTAPLFGGFERAGIAVSVVAGAAAAVALHGFLARAFDRRTALFGALLLALHPYAAMFSADVQSEGLYTALFLGAVGASWRAATETGLRPAALAGALAGAAYLVRPEGLGVAFAAVVFAALRLWQGRLAVAGFARCAGALAVGAAVVAGPYLLYLHDDTGAWRLTRKKSVSDLVAPEGRVAPDASRGETDRERFEPPARPGPPPSRSPRSVSSPRAPQQASLLPARVELEPRALSAVFDLLLVSTSALHPLVVLLVALGAVSLRGPPGERAWFLAIVLGLYGVVLYGLALNVGYLDRRHVLTPLLPLLGYAALGLPGLGRWLHRLSRPRVAAPDDRLAAWVALAVFAGLTLPKTWAPHREERLANRRAAEWLASRADLSGPVSAEKHRTAWYAGEAFVHLARGGPEGDVAALARAGARFLVVDDVQAGERPALQAAIEEGSPLLREIYSAEAAGRTSRVYELEAPALAPEPEAP